MNVLEISDIFASGNEDVNQWGKNNVFVFCLPESLTPRLIFRVILRV